MTLEEIVCKLAARPVAALTPAGPYDPALSAVIHASNCSPLLKAGLLLWNDDLDASHRLSQQIDTPTGSYWHAIMHRREPDYWNSKYWFRLVGEHPAMLRIAQEANTTLRTMPWLAGGRYNPLAFVDACQKTERADVRAAELAPLQAFQMLEIRILIEHTRAMSGA